MSAQPFRASPDDQESNATLKARLRAALRAWTKQVSPADRLAASESVCRQIREHRAWQESATVLLYAPLSDELDLSQLVGVALGAGKRVALPQFDAALGRYRACQILTTIDALAPGRFNIPEPGSECLTIPLKQLDFIAVPGVGFDVSGRRLGRGRGYYDRLLADICGCKCGVAYDQQVTAQIPVEEHDILLDCIVTPSRWLNV